MFINNASLRSLSRSDMFDLSFLPYPTNARQRLLCVAGTMVEMEVCEHFSLDLPYFKTPRSNVFGDGEQVVVIDSSFIELIYDSVELTRAHKRRIPPNEYPKRRTQTKNPNEYPKRRTQNTTFMILVLLTRINIPCWRSIDNEYCAADDSDACRSRDCCLDSMKTGMQVLQVLPVHAWCGHHSSRLKMIG